MATVEVVIAVISLLALSLLGFLFRGKITHPLTNWPLLGHLGPFLINTRLEVHDYVTYLLSHSGYTAQLKGPPFTRLNCVATSDPQNIHYILSSNMSNFNKGPNFKKIFDLWGDGILAADADSWRFHRRLNRSLFNHSSFLGLVERTARQKMEGGMFPILDQAAKLGNAVDLRDLFQRFTIDITCKFLLGIDLNSLSIDLPVVPFSKAFDEVKQVMYYRHIKPETLWRLQKWMKIGLEGKAIKGLAIINEFIYQQISFKRERMRKGIQEDVEFDMISRFMMVEDEASETQNGTTSMPISDMFLRDSVVNILSAGRDPPSTALTWFFWLVSTHPSVDKKIKDELKEAFHLKEGEKWQFPSFQDINKLVYLHAAIHETLRLYPPVPLNHKTSIEPDTLPSGDKVGKDQEILISYYTQARMESIWGADCLEFKPERWISEKGEIIHVGSSKFTTFNAGPRACLGKDLALMEMKLAITAVIWNYRIEVVKGHSVAPANSIILYPKHGLKVHIYHQELYQR
uniref:Cytochrome P450 n=1 Tax=Kalanchoe fedtschenkoi TaxID=63787 RepID=A0A7N0U331_KALFE